MSVLAMQHTHETRKGQVMTMLVGEDFQLSAPVIRRDGVVSGYALARMLRISAAPER